MEFIGYFEYDDVDGYDTIVKENDLYYSAMVCNAGAMKDSDGFESLEELYDYLYQRKREEESYA